MTQAIRFTNPMDPAQCRDEARPSLRVARFPVAEPDATESEVVAALEAERLELQTELREWMNRSEDQMARIGKLETMCRRYGLDPDAPNCQNCGDPIQPGHARGEYRGTAMHRVCALELRLAEIER